MAESRRELLKGLVSGAAIAKAAGPETAPRSPNILFILSDDHSVPFLGPYGAKFLSTPNLDRFAAEGVRFDRAFTASPLFVPSRTALMTGRSPIAAQVGRFSQPLPPNVTTLPEELRK